MALRILVVGGYGGVGKELVKCLIQHHNGVIIIGGPNEQKAKSLREKLLSQYPEAQVEALYLDATQKESLLHGFGQVDLAIITATVPEQMALIAETALESQIDLMDILMRGDVVHTLQKFENRIKAKNLRFFTQCGFHPGLVAPIIRMATPHFDIYKDAEVMMAMDGVFKQPDAIKEILYEVSTPSAYQLKNGHWRKAGYKDAKTFTFSEYFGRKNCYPMQMSEIEGIDERLGLENCSVHASGFDDYIDQFVFPLAMVLGFFSKRLSLAVCSRLFFKRIQHKKNQRPRAELVVRAKGLKNGKTRKMTLTLFSEDSFQLTAIALLGLLNQYLDNTLAEPGLHLMGRVCDEKRLFRDIEKMGVSLRMEGTL